MPEIVVKTFMPASPEVCFDLARNMQVHEQTTGGTSERVVEITKGGVPQDLTAEGTSLLELGDTVTFEAKHLGVRQRLTARIVAYERPLEFVDEMVKGALKELRHVHRFEAVEGGTSMTDAVRFRSPGGIFGSVIDTVFMSNYLKRFLAARGAALARLASLT